MSGLLEELQYLYSISRVAAVPADVHDTCLAYFKELYEFIKNEMDTETEA